MNNEMHSFTKESGPRNIPVDACSPFDVFSCLFPQEFVSNITEQTNLYALQKFGDPQKFKKTNEEEMKAFLGINIFMGIKRLPSIKDYWSSNEEIRDNYISSIMPRNRFMWMLGNIHLNDNYKQPKKGEPGYDKLYKLRPLLDKLQYTYNFYYDADEHQSVDESMIKFKGRSSLRQYMPQKPIKRGYKIWVRANKSGYIAEFQIYTGKVDSAEKHLGTRVVKDLTKNIAGEYHKVYFDNYFTSMNLMNDLKNSKIHGCGIVRKDRKGLPKDLKRDKEMNRGDADWRITKTGIVSMKTMDKRGIYFLSNFHDPEKANSVQRKMKDGTIIEVSCPDLVRDYNENMGHVDKADMLKSLYEIDRKSKRWWLRIFWHFIDVTIVNAFVLFRKRCDCQSLELKEFRVAVARGLIGMHRCEKRRRRNDDYDLSHKKFKRQVPNETRQTESKHMPMYGTSVRCGFCSTNRTSSHKMALYSV
ncbi:piggyBac transposable element-derived protein 4-like [Coccinella septempunctata]|uniref:piggyBac transposable element-derived protein 4-like n=1 Tax=Coccinella septempunctata TaxID=41139 RepID=UPI001D0765C4|nr:piggyBac transposable element-derived protein 4-like [Coccinella septempunctata]